MKKTRQAKTPRRVPGKKKPPVRARGHEDFLTASIDTASAGAAAAAAAVEKRSLGERIREARKMRGLTLEDLSSRSGVSVDGLERVEANRAIPPLGQLVRLGKALEMKMGYFLSAGVDKPMCVVRSDARPKVARHGKHRSEQYGYVYESLAPEKTNRLMEPFLVTLTPTEFGEFSSHDGQEFLFVLEGEIRVQVGKEVEVLRAGDSIYYDSSHPHLVKCYGERPAKILAVIHAGAGAGTKSHHG
jgi:quercetin dioxygenase-like cupin family protein/DNA-binding XRE family transcriptional regulator